MDTPANQIPSFSYDPGKQWDIGSGYAAGITAAGQGIAKGVEGALDVMNRNRTADDMLTALNQAKILGDDQYKAIAGKSLGAKEQLTGMFANQWILDQANQRALSLQRGQGGVDVATTHAKLLDLYNQVKAGNPAALDVKKQYWQPPQTTQPPTTQPPSGAPQPPPGPQAVAAAQQQAGQYGRGSVVQGAPPPAASAPQKAPLLPGARYGKRTDATGKSQTGWQLPSGQFIPDST